MNERTSASGPTLITHFLTFITLHKSDQKSERAIDWIRWRVNSFDNGSCFICVMLDDKKRVEAEIWEKAIIKGADVKITSGEMINPRKWCLVDINEKGQGWLKLSERRQIASVHSIFARIALEILDRHLCEWFPSFFLYLLRRVLDVLHVVSVGRWLHPYVWHGIWKSALFPQSKNQDQGKEIEMKRRDREIEDEASSKMAHFTSNKKNDYKCMYKYQ